MIMIIFLKPDTKFGTGRQIAINPLQVMTVEPYGEGCNLLLSSGRLECVAEPFEAVVDALSRALVALPLSVYTQTGGLAGPTRR